MKCMICGMDININNFGINNEGLLVGNEKEHIEYCPFCGVGLKYMNFEGEIYTASAKNLDVDTLVILDHAMKLEIFNSDFYKAASKLAHSESVKKTFEALSKIELMHAMIHQKLGGFKELSELQYIDYSKHKDDKSLMNLAETREIHAARYYEKHLNKINDDAIKEVFIALSQVERDHIQIAKNY
jgi:rubrerythrin